MHRRFNIAFELKKRKGNKDRLWKEHKSKIILSQGYKCAICLGIIDLSSPLDHDHETGVIRGVLCGKCNLGLGMFNDSCYLFDKATAYILKHKQIGDNQGDKAC